MDFDFSEIVNAVLLFLFGQSIIQWFNSQREGRQVGRWQLGNTKNFVFEKYHSAETREYRESLDLPGSNAARDLQSRANYELATALQQLGLNAYIGTIPLQPILAGNATRIVSDWVLVYGHIDYLRDGMNDNAVPFHRRHAEWLACICLLWIT